jgi:hypothetical protein
MSRFVDTREKVKRSLAYFLSSEPDSERGRDSLRWVEKLNEKDPDWIANTGFDYCAYLAIDLIRDGQPLPPPIDRFAIDVLSGNATRMERGPRGYKDHSRNAAIEYALAVATGDGLNLYRNDASSTISACDMVAECLQEFGIYIDYKTVAKVRQTGLWAYLGQLRQE